MPKFFTAIGEARAWRELTYALVGFPVGIAGFVFVVTALSVSAGLAVTLIGIPLLAVTVSASRGMGAAMAISVSREGTISSRRGFVQKRV